MSTTRPLNVSMRVWVGAGLLALVSACGQPDTPSVGSTVGVAPSSSTVTSAPATMSPATRQPAAVVPQAVAPQPLVAAPRAAAPPPVGNPVPKAPPHPAAPRPAAPSPLPPTPGQPAAPPAHVAGSTVHAGAFCDDAGATGVTDTGTAMRCQLDSKGKRLRWSKA